MKIKRLSQRQIGAIAFCVFSAVMMLGCPSRPTPLVVVPSSPNDDNAPSIKIDNLLVGDGNVDKNEVGTISALPATALGVFVTRHARLQLLGTATNTLGGVKTFSLRVNEGKQLLYSADVSSAQDSNGKAPTFLNITLGDKQGREDRRVAISFVVSGGVTLTAEATNFNGQTNKLVLNYQPVDPLQAELSVTPDTIAAGGTANLHFLTQNAFETSLTGSTNGVSFQINPGLSNDVLVSPSQTTIYTLSANQAFPGTTAGFPNPPPSSGQTIHETRKTLTATLTVNTNTNAEPSSTGGISGTYFFDLPDASGFATHLDVVFTGKILTSTGSVGGMSFSVNGSSSDNLPGGSKNNPVSFQVAGLKKGLWEVTATPQPEGGAIAAGVICKVNVPPGLIQLSVAGGAGPKCSSP